MITIKTNITLLFICLMLALPANAAKVSIIIDDIGYRKTDSLALSLPGQITYAVLPHTPYGKQLADKVSQQNKDVMLHIPMEALNGKFMGPGGLSSDMTQPQVIHELKLALENIPQAIGINNHMGSKLTAMPEHMQWTMEFLREHNLFFLDSKTNRHSVAEKTAKRVGVATLSRHVFLDNHLTENYIKGQFEQLIRHAKRHQNTIAIAHPHPESIAILTKLIPTLADNGIELVPVSELLSEQPTHQVAASITD